MIRCDPEDESLAPRFSHTSAADLEVVEGDSLRITCRVSGRPPPNIFWYFNGQRLSQVMIFFLRVKTRSHGDLGKGQGKKYFSNM